MNRDKIGTQTCYVHQHTFYYHHMSVSKYFYLGLPISCGPPLERDRLGELGIWEDWGS